MTPALLIDSLAEYLSKVLKNYDLPAEYQRNKKLSVYKYDLPYGNFEEDTYLPYVIITPRLIDEVENYSIVTVTILIGVYTGEPGNDWLDLMNIAEKIRQSLLTIHTLEKRFIREHDLHFEPVTPEQPSPFALGYFECNFRVAHPEPAFENFYFSE